MRFVPLLLLAACADPHVDVVGPYTGEARRFVVDSIELPMTNLEAYALGGLIDDNDAIDNQVGYLLGFLAGYDDVTMHGADMIAAGAIASSVIITADDFTNDGTVSVLYLGSDDATGVAVGGSLGDGVFEPNRSRYTKVPGSATLHLPVFVDADPSIVPVVRLEIELTSDGSGGFDAALHGAVPHDALLDVAYESIAQMIASNPAEHPAIVLLLDAPPRDGLITRDEFQTNPLITSLMAPDLVIGGQGALSFGFRAHLSPCAEGRCNEPVASCYDRVLDGDEAHVDCGGSCWGCLAGATCTTATDCESRDCTGGVCGPPRCDNGVRDGFETDVDCGKACGVGCATGQRCYDAGDCAHGTCGPCNPRVSSCDDFKFDTCR
ncbi:MAG: hypothetical protein HOV81_17635 [Kofleriaceae bacterium]|nr:hypothetical protein [Kofleriaceae bacterium]